MPRTVESFPFLGTRFASMNLFFKVERFFELKHSFKIKLVTGLPEKVSLSPKIYSTAFITSPTVAIRLADKPRIVLKFPANLA
ncbi:hypothetical protein [Pectobacterium cacticida]|uniref:hypothetical protein n=1 Tax=Pectobacterium cacticida TaxID=69221 RepID=UPI0039872DF8